MTLMCLYIITVTVHEIILRERESPCSVLCCRCWYFRRQERAALQAQYFLYLSFTDVYIWPDSSHSLSPAIVASSPTCHTLNTDFMSVFQYLSHYVLLCGQSTTYQTTIYVLFIPILRDWTICFNHLSQVNPRLPTQMKKENGGLRCKRHLLCNI